MLSNAPRRRIAELLALYELEPSVRDIFVEGHFDAAVYSEIVARSGRHWSKHIIAIDTVDVPATLVKSYGLTVGNKQEVQTLALTLRKELGPNFDRVLCIVDDDTDTFFDDNLEMPSFVISTDYSTIEMYLFSDELLSRFAKMFLQGANREKTMKAAIAQCKAQLPDALCARLALRELSLEIEWIDVGGQLEKDGFSIEKYLEKLANKGRLSKAKKEGLKTAVARWRVELEKLPTRQKIHGKDFVSFVWQRVKKECRLKGVSDAQVFPAVLALYLDWIGVENEPLFKRLMA